jgi:SAM-dependent methyltransferase
MPVLKSYTSERNGVVAFLREAKNLYKAYMDDLPKRVQRAIEDSRRVEDRIRDRLGIELRNLDILEIGPGQFLTQMTYLAAHNRVVGIDLDVIVRGFSPLAYAKMLQVNGPRRTAKTLGRKLLGVDRQFSSELKKQLHLEHFPHLPLYQMDVCNMSFACQSVDFVYSRAVFHHLPNPSLAIDQVVRILRPGGVAYISIHLYTSETGCLDPRIFTRNRDQVRWWPHLRPHLQHTVKANAYLNKLRLEQWRSLFSSKMPGVEVHLTPSTDAGLEAAARALHQQGELLDYSLTELLTGEFVALWKKPL